MKVDTLGKRYAFKLGANVAGLPVNFLVQVLATRSLGPAAYGSFSFLNGFFMEVVTFLDAGTSTALYTKLCARPQERALTAFYWRLAGVIALVLLGLVAVVQLAGAGHLVWPGQLRGYVWLGAACALGMWMTNTVGRIVDAYGRTAMGEVARLVQRILLLAGLIALWGYGSLTLSHFFVAQIAAALVLWWLSERVLRRTRETLLPFVALSREQTRAYCREFWEYSHPLITYAFAGLVGGVADKWMLQRFAGSVEQGFFGLATQVGTVCFLLTSSFVPLIGREFAQAHHARDTAALRRQFETHSQRFYELTCVVSVFMAFNARDIALLVGGAAYAPAVPALALMCFAPAHQTYGQLNGSLFYATGRTRQYRNVGIVCLCLGLLLNFVFLAPRTWGGMELGALGLATKWVLLQIISVNVQLWLNARYLNIPMRSFLTRQLIFPLAFAALAWMTTSLVQPLNFAWQRFVVGGLIYLLLFLGCAWSAPALFRAPIKDWIRQFFALISGPRGRE
jgi:O-antigen/teichoic acid export membrane protein